MNKETGLAKAALQDRVIFFCYKKYNRNFFIAHFHRPITDSTGTSGTKKG